MRRISGLVVVMLLMVRKKAATNCWISAVSLIALASARGQGVSWIPPAWDQALPVQVDRIDIQVVNDLRRLETMIADRQWSEAAQLWCELRDTSGSMLVNGQLPREGWNHLIPLREWLARQLRQSTPWYPELRAAYRALNDPTAHELWQRGDPEARAALVRDFAGSSDASAAAAALAELALERADFNTARHLWQRSLTELDESTGTTDGRTARSPEVAKAEAQLVLVSILQGDQDRAKRELRQFADRYPDAAGILAGQSGNLAKSLRVVYQESQTWPVFEQRPSPLGQTGQTETERTVCRRKWRFSLKDVLAVSQPTLPDRTPPLDVHTLPAVLFRPCVVEDRVLLRDDFQVLALDRSTGRPVEGAGEWGLIFRDTALQARWQPPQTPPWGAPQFELFAGHGLLLARMGCVASIISEGNSVERAPSQIIGWEPETWKAVVRIEAPHGWGCEGTPMTDGVRIYSCLRQRIGQSPLYLAAFDRNTGNLLWRRLVAASETPGRGMIDEIHHASVDLREGLLICCSQSGVIAAYTLDGDPEWMAIYPQRQGAPAGEMRVTSRVYSRDLMICAAPDAAGVFCLDTVTGTTRWTTDLPESQWEYLLGTAAEHVIVGGRGLRWLDQRTGQQRFQVTLRSGDTEYGHGCLAGEVVIWPAGDSPQLQFRSARDGSQVREPLLVEDEATLPGDVSIAGHCILICSNHQIVAWDCSSPPREAERDE